MALNYCLLSLCPSRQLPEVHAFSAWNTLIDICLAWPFIFLRSLPSITLERPSLISFSVIVVRSFCPSLSFPLLYFVFYHCLPLNICLPFCLLAECKIHEVRPPHLSMIRVHNRHIVGFYVWISLWIPFFFSFFF